MTLSSLTFLKMKVKDTEGWLQFDRPKPIMHVITHARNDASTCNCDRAVAETVKSFTFDFEN